MLRNFVISVTYLQQNCPIGRLRCRQASYIQILPIASFDSAEKLIIQQAVAQTASQSSSEEQETGNIFSELIWATACQNLTLFFTTILYRH
jgi:hypothetical protein